MIVELARLDQVRSACGDDDLLMWAAQGLSGGVRAWALGDGVVVASPGVSRRDRLAVWGGAACVTDLVRHALAEVGPSYRPFGDVELMADVTVKLAGVEAADTFCWMSLPGLPAPAPDAAPDAGAVTSTGAVTGHLDASRGGWLGPESDAEVAGLLAAAAPQSYAVPGMAGVRRWAGVWMDEALEGRALAAVAADAWSAPSVGFLAGVATAARFRGRGLAERLCRWVSGELVAARGRAALMVDDGNLAAIRVYERIGYRRRAVMASRAV
ncbi:GNAT family N-acetyltransferase [Nonomuraea sp. NPDC049269]|uniref:GNAT family N-acetyltransferase n=1 Tax=Nonomuraea sp. NPDC049269 TaxID=3364349 RepID=UPI003715F386